jgi:2-dehydropantoate 2-reductase
VWPATTQLAKELEGAGIPTRVLDSESEALWGKLVRLNALACTTSAWDVALGEIRDHPGRRAVLERCVAEGAAVARAEGAQVDPATVMGELEDAHATLGSSMQRDIAAGREPELDAIPGAVLRAAARHGLECPAIDEMVALIRARLDGR